MRSPRRWFSGLHAALVLLSLLLGPKASTAVDTYTVILLNPMTFVSGINSSGIVSGNIGSVLTSSNEAAYWDGSAPVPIGTLGGDFSQAFDVGDSGAVVGESLNAAGESQAFVWDGLSMSELPTLGGDSGVARSINDFAVVVGRAEIPGIANYSHAVRWTNGQAFDLGTLGGTVSEAWDINGSGQIVGWARTPTISSRAALWENGTVTDLGTLGGTLSHANAINDAGQIVGQAQVTGNTTWHACLWEAGGVLDIGTLGGSQSEAFDINASGQIVGQSQMSTGGAGGFLWEDGTLYRITDLLVPEDAAWSITSAQAINDDGWIAGWGRLGNGTYPVLLQPATAASVPSMDRTGFLLLTLALVCGASAALRSTRVAHA